VIKTEYKMMKVKRDGQNKLVPARRKSIFGFGRWKEDPDWEAEEQRIAEEKYLGLDPDSTVTQIHAFINKRDITTIKNNFYND
jgi:hypothetical protein